MALRGRPGVVMAPVPSAALWRASLRRRQLEGWRVGSAKVWGTRKEQKRRGMTRLCHFQDEGRQECVMVDVWEMSKRERAHLPCRQLLACYLCAAAVPHTVAEFHEAD